MNDQKMKILNVILNNCFVFFVSEHLQARLYFSQERVKLDGFCFHPLYQESNFVQIVKSQLATV